MNLKRYTIENIRERPYYTAKERWGVVARAYDASVEEWLQEMAPRVELTTEALTKSAAKA